MKGGTQSIKRDRIDEWAFKKNLAWVCLHEFKINCNMTMETDNYIWYTSTGVAIEDKQKTDTLRSEGKQIGDELRRKTAEHLGV